MNNNKQFIAQQGSNTTVKIYEAGNIVSSPYVSGNVMTVTVEASGRKQIKTFTLPSGGLKTTIPA